MDGMLKKSLPVVAVVSAVVMLVCIAGSTLSRGVALQDTGQTRPQAEATLARLQALHPTAVSDPAFVQAAANAEGDPYVVYVWLFAPDGRILRGNLAIQPGSTVDTMATDETQRVVNALPADALDGEQRQALLAASAMQAEGEHNDVFRQLLRPVRAPDGSLAGLVGVTYDVSPERGLPSLFFIALVLVGLAAMAVYWLSLPLWVWLDARRRGERAVVWAVFVLLGNLVALLAYILVRVPRPEVLTAA